MFRFIQLFEDFNNTWRNVHKHKTIDKNIMAEKLTDEEKLMLIELYGGNPCRWDGNNPNHNNKELKLATKEEMTKHFDGKYIINALEK